MNYIFFVLIFVAILTGFIAGTLDKVTSAMLSGCELAVKIALSLIGVMAFWLGLMRIAEKSGFIKFLAKLIYPFAKPLFKDVSKDSKVIGDITMSLSANSLGLTNAATPIGIKVMKELQEENKNKEIANDNMCMFLAMNTAGFQIIPTSVIAVLVACGAQNPSEIILPTLIVTTISFAVAILTALIFRLVWKNKEER